MASQQTDIAVTRLQAAWQKHSQEMTDHNLMQLEAAHQQNAQETTDVAAMEFEAARQQNSQATDTAATGLQVGHQQYAQQITAHHQVQLQAFRQQYAQDMIGHHRQMLDELLNVEDFVRRYENRQAYSRILKGEFQYLTRIRPAVLPEEVDYFGLPFYPQIPGITTVPDYAWVWDRPKIQALVARVLADWNEADASRAQTTGTEES